MKKIEFLWKTYSRYLPLLLWMVLIFWFSAQDADSSDGMSGKIVEWITDFWRTFMPSSSPSVANTEILNFLIRKSAHFGNYFLLAAICCRCFSTSDSQGVQWKVLTVCFIYACSDELHQRMIPGRMGAFGDVLIDMAGVLLFLLLYTVIKNRKQKVSIENSED